MTTLVVSAHLDDAVFSCAHHLLTHPGAVVATVMAGRPGGGILSEWDRICGFVPGDDPVGRRRQEDRAALALLGARPRHLDFLDIAYRDRPGAADVDATATTIARRLIELVEEVAPERLLIPLGLLHPDHALTHDAGLLARRTPPAMETWAYADLPYALAIPGLVSSRLAALRQGGVSARAVPVEPPAQPDIKRSATACYASQVGRVTEDLGLDAMDRTHLVGSERFWQLSGDRWGDPQAGR